MQCAVLTSIATMFMALAAARYRCFCSESAPVDEGAHACTVLRASLCYSARAGHCMTDYSTAATSQPTEKRLSTQPLASLAHKAIAHVAIKFAVVKKWLLDKESSDCASASSCSQ
eukprot:13722-Heterococcus_DN1.PRE.1